MVLGSHPFSLHSGYGRQSFLVPSPPGLNFWYVSKENVFIKITEMEEFVCLTFMLKALRLGWLPKLLNPVKQNWKSIPDHFFRKLGDLNFLLRCNYDPRYLHPKLPIFIEIYCRSSSKYNVNLTLFRLGFFGQSVTGGAP